MGTSSIGVSAGALRDNLLALRAVGEAAAVGAGQAPEMLAVIKADAYGHGAALCAPVLARAGAAWLGVSDAAEGARVRRAVEAAGAGSPEILVMCGMDPAGAAEAMALVLRHGLTPVVWTAAQVEAAGRAAAAGGESVVVHVEVDTGMSRQGARPGAEMRTVLEALGRWRGAVRVGGAMTHFASAEVVGAAETVRQMERFGAALGEVTRWRETGGVRGAETMWVHAGNTSTVDEAGLLPWVGGQAKRMGGRVLLRTGLGLYGYALPLEGETAEARVRGRVRPVATWRTRVVAVKELPAGEAVGYNGMFVAGRPMRLALLPVGYADGLRRELSGTNARAGGEVVVRGQRAAMVGRVSMNLTTVDVTEVPGVVAGDAVTLLGPAPGPTAEEHARWAGTIAYEVLCGMRGERFLERDAGGEDGGGALRG